MPSHSALALMDIRLMHTFLDNFHQGGKYSAHIAIHQVELRREETFTDQKSLNISSLQTDYLNLDISPGFGRNSEIENNVQTKCTFCEGTNHSAEKCFKSIRQEKEKDLAAVDLDNKLTEQTPRKCFRCGYEDHLIAKCPKQPKDNKKQRKQVSLMKKLIVHTTTAKITATKIYMHLWHTCLAFLATG